jgi:release factor glutamine methyltransferase
MQRIDEWLKSATYQLSNEGSEVQVSESPRLDAELLLGFVIDKTRTWLFTWPEKTISLEQKKTADELLARRIMGEPIAHLIAQREFWSLNFKCNNTTLIPRPDTECLIEKVLTLNLLPEAHILDLGTGTGAIICALASEFPQATCLGVDYSSDAVKLATDNKTALSLDHVTIKQSDWFSEVTGIFDLIISNPPYIDENDEHLSQGDVRFEPLSALVAKNKGLADIESITMKAKSFLADGGWLMFEHGWQQAEVVQEILLSSGFEHVESGKDYGGNLRYTLGRLT